MKVTKKQLKRIIREESSSLNEQLVLKNKLENFNKSVNRSFANLLVRESYISHRDYLLLEDAETDQWLNDLDKKVGKMAKKAGGVAKIGIKGIRTLLRPIAGQAIEIGKELGKFAFKNVPLALGQSVRFLGSSAKESWVNIRDTLKDIKDESDFKRLALKNPKAFQAMHSEYARKFDGMGLPVKTVEDAMAYVGLSSSDTGYEILDGAAESAGVGMDVLLGQLNVFGYLLKYIHMAEKQLAKTSAGNQEESTNESRQIKVTKRQLKRIIRESILSEAKMQDIITNEYEDVDDYNVLANFALTGDIAGALAHPDIKHYVDKNEMGWFADDAITWFEQVGGDEGYLPAPEGWDRDKAFDFLKDLESAAWKVYQKQEDAAIAADPDKEFLEFLGNEWTSTISPDDMKGIKWKEYKKYIRLKPPPSISHGVGEINVSKENIKALYSGAYEDFMDFLTTRSGGQLGRRAPYRRSPPPIYD